MSVRTTTEPVITVVTVCLNAERHIEDAVQSVLGQEYAATELVIVDGGSQDSTLDIVRSFEPLFGGRLRWISEPDKGLYDAMNKGLALARGDIVGILNADDVYEPDAFRSVAAALEREPEAGIVYGDTRNIDEDGRITLERPAPPKIMSATMTDMFMGHQSMFVTAKTYRELGGYDTDYRLLADFEFVRRCVREGVEFAYTGTPLSRFRVGGVSGSAIRELDRERTKIRIAYGANPIAQWALFYKHGVSIRVHRLLSRLGLIR